MAGTIRKYQKKNNLFRRRKSRYFNCFSFKLSLKMLDLKTERDKLSNTSEELVRLSEEVNQMRKSFEKFEKPM